LALGEGDRGITGGIPTPTPIAKGGHCEKPHSQASAKSRHLSFDPELHHSRAAQGKKKVEP
jgi:hypothetical protein